MRFPGTKLYLVTARFPQMVRDQKSLGNTALDSLSYFWRPTAKSSWNKARIRYNRLCLPLDYLNLTHTDGQISSPET